MSNEPPGATRDLRELLQTLPQELYDNIYGEVFTAEPSKVVIWRYSYKWPHLFHVDRASRAAYAKSYFGLTTLFCHSDFELRWVRTLCDQHVKFIKGLFFLYSSDEDGPLVRLLKYMQCCDRLRILYGKKAERVQVIDRSEAKKSFGI